MYCEQCGARCQQIHETTVRRVRDLPLFEYRVVLHVPRRRVWGESCGGPRLEKLAWLGRNQRVTERFAKACEKLLQSASVQAVAAFYDLGWHTVKSIDKMRLRARVAEPDWSTIRYLAMDEFALHKGHRYAAVVVDPIGRQVLWVGAGRSRETTRAFFEQLPEGVAERIEAVAIDMTTAYELEIKEQCPQAVNQSKVVTVCEGKLSLRRLMLTRRRKKFGNSRGCALRIKVVTGEDRCQLRGCVGSGGHALCEIYV